MNPTPSPSKVVAFIAIGVGGLLLLSGCAAAIGYLGLPVFAFGQDILTPQLGQMAAMFLGLICGPLAIYHGFKSIANRPSRPFKLPPFYFFWIVFAIALGLGNVILNSRVAANYLFPPIFLLGAALPTLAVVAWVARRLGWPLTWRQAALALVSGSTLSILVAIVIESSLSYIIYLLTAPLWFFGSFDPSPRFFLSPTVILFLFITALQAPIPEEFAKALGLPLFGRGRITNERQALLIGLISGAGFAILENMLYEGLYAQYNGWSWGGVTLLRGIGAVLHTLCTAIVALGWFRMRTGGVGQLLKAYALAVGVHTLWNGGFAAFIYITGLDYYGGSSLNFYDTAIPTLLVVFLIGLSLALWWLLRRLVNNLSQGVEVELLSPTPARIPTRNLAGWAVASAFIIVPIGVAVGSAWPTLLQVLSLGR